MKARGPWGNWLVNDKWKGRRKPASEQIQGEACQPQGVASVPAAAVGEEKAFAADVQRRMTRGRASYRQHMAQVTKRLGEYKRQPKDLGRSLCTDCGTFDQRQWRRKGPPSRLS